MELPVALHKKIVDFLILLPQIHESRTQQALIYSTGLDQRLQQQIDLNGSVSQVIQELVVTLNRYGKLEDGRYALEAILEAAKDLVGQDNRAYCDTILEELQKHVKNPKEQDVNDQKSSSFREEFVGICIIYFTAEQNNPHFIVSMFIIALFDLLVLWLILRWSGNGRSGMIGTGFHSSVVRFHSF